MQQISQSLFKTYLSFSKQWFNLQKQQITSFNNVNIVLGNESADMDSTIGSLILAYLRFHHNHESILQQKQPSNPTSLKPIPVNLEEISRIPAEQVYLPIIQCKRDELQSRFECMNILSLHNINISDLVFKDEIDMDSLTASSNSVQVLLFDHNRTSYANLAPHVVEIIDHHADTTNNNDGFYKHKIPLKNITTIGSATSLLGEMFIAGEVDASLLEYVVADSILKTIVLDTYNFQPKQEGIRWNSRDQIVFNYLKAFIEKNYSIPIDNNQIARSLELLKFDAKSNIALGLQKLLVKDYKKFQYASNRVNVGYSVFMVSPEDLFNGYPLSTGELENELSAFITLNQLDLLLLLFAYPLEPQEEEKTGQTMGRKIVAVAADPSKLELLKAVETKLQTELKLQSLDYSANLDKYSKSYFAFSGDETYTRKVFEPVVSKVDFEALLALKPNI